jgi:hypothetical protein
MSIDTVTSSNASGLANSSSTASQAAAASSAVSPLLTKAHQRLQSEASATTTQLSKFGLLKSALSQGQTSAQALTKLASTASDSDTTTAMGTFFNTFNASTAAARTASVASGSSAASNSAKRVATDLKTVLRSDPASSDALKTLGLTLQSDGSLLQDPKKFAASLSANPSGTRAAMALLGKKVDALSSKELAASGMVGSALTGLNQHGAALAAQQKALASLSQAMATSSTSTQSGVLNGLLGSGLAAYQSNQSGY